MRSEGRLDREASTRVGWSRLLPALLTGGILAGTLPTDAQPEPAFVDVALDVGLDFIIKIGPPFKDTAPLEVMQREMGNGAAVGDYDNDGDLDIYLVGQTGFPNRLYRNDLETGSRGFTDVTPPELGELGLSRMAHFVDLDGDGWLDLVVINDDDGTDATPPSRIFRNNGDSSFTDVTAGSGFRPIGFLRAGCALADFDRDGLIDLYVTVWAGRGLEGQFSFPGSNRLYRNLGNFRFRDVTEQANLGGLDRNSFAAIFADFNGDLFPDLFVAVDNTSDEFYWNNRGVFERATEEVGLTHIGNDMGIAAADFDDDGDLDLYVTNITDASAGGVRFGTEQFNALHVNRLSDEGVTRFDNLAGERGVRDTYWG